jgi:acyl-CoA synthetase (AMP-forming)/AMP-acid ligase II
MSATSGSDRGLCIDDVFRHNAKVVPDRPAAGLGDRVLTHRELNALANRTARALRAAGVRHGDRIVTWAETHLSQVPLFAAAAKLGAVFAPVNARLGLEEASVVARIAKPRMVVVDPELRKLIKVGFKRSKL